MAGGSSASRFALVAALLLPNVVVIDVAHGQAHRPVASADGIHRTMGMRMLTGAPAAQSSGNTAYGQCNDAS